MKEIDPNFTYAESQEHYITHSVLQIGTNKIMIAEQAIDSTRPWQLSNSSSFCIQSKDFQAIVRDPFGIVIQLTVTRHDF
ncbi:VOC family protein [Bacillus sp. NP247]|nr:VOC family protein [Bacillus sp. NP247]